MKYFPGVSLYKYKFKTLREYINFSIHFIEATIKFHKFASHNDLHAGNIIMTDDQVRLIDLGLSDFKKNDATFLKDRYDLWNILTTYKPKNINTLTDLKIVNNINEAIESIIINPLEKSLQKFKEISKQETIFSKESFNQLHQIFIDTIKNKNVSEFKSIKHIESLFSGYQDEKDLNGSIDVILGALIKDKKLTMRSCGYFFKKSTDESMFLSEIIDKFRDYIKMHVKIPNDTFFITKLKHK